MPYVNPLTRDFIHRLSVVNPVTGCWIWASAIDPRGYGVLTQNPNGQRFAHRLSFELFKERIPDDMTVDHLCFQTDCVNPDHLRLLPNEVNAVRKEPAEAKAWRLANQIALPKRSRQLTIECHKGHPRTPENTRIRVDGAQSCRTCERESQRRRRAEKRKG